MKKLIDFINEELIQEGIMDKIKEKFDKLMQAIKPEEHFSLGVSANYISENWNTSAGQQISSSEVADTLCNPVLAVIKKEAKDFIVNEETFHDGYFAENTSYVNIDCTEEEAIAVYEKAVAKFVELAQKEVGKESIAQHEYPTNHPKGLQHVVDAEYYAELKDGSKLYFYPCVWLWRPNKKHELPIKLMQNSFERTAKNRGYKL